MAGKLLSMDEAARILGVVPAELNEMRMRQEIFGMRDGASWKFKEEEVERVRGERASGGSAEEDYTFGLADDEPSSAPGLTDMIENQPLPLNLLEDESDVVLLSETELGDSALAASNTVIGGTPGGEPGSDIHRSATGGDVNLDSDLKLMESDIKLADSDVTLAPSAPSTGDSKIFTEHNQGNLESATILTSEASSGLGSSIKLSIDDDNVLGGSSSGSDITINPGDSGIQLVDPSDSGLSLEEPLELGRSDDMLDIGMADSDSALAVEGEDDFLLTPLEEASDEESDSGSQVIALDTEGDFEDATATLLGSQIPGLLDEDSGQLDPLGMPGGAAAMGGGAAAAAAGPVTVIRSETRFSGLDVVLLSMCLLGLSVTGIMMYDLVRNMWSWETPYSFNSSLMDMIVGKG